MAVDFCAEESVRTKSFAVKEKQEVQVTTRVLSGKMLTFCEAFPYELYLRAFENVLFSRRKS